MSIELPEDIWHGIARHLKDDVTSLHALASTSRNFTPIAQRQIFYHINLPGKLNPETYSHWGPPKSLTNLISILTQNPLLATYIHDLHLLQMDHSPPDQPMMSSSIPWIRHHSGVLVDLIELLEPSPIQSFTLLFYEAANMGWNHLDLFLRSNLLENILHKPTLRHLRIEGISIPHQIFLYCGGLESLALITASATSDSIEDEISEPLLPASSHPHKIQRFYYSPPISETKPLDFIGPNGSVDFSELQFLFLNFISSTLTPVANLLRIRSLTELYLEPAIHWDNPPTTDLSALVNLSKLTILFEAAKYVKPSFITWTGDILSSLPTTQPAFNTFLLQVKAYDPKELNLSLYQQLSAPLRDMHKRLQGTLKRATVSVAYSGQNIQGVDAFVSDLSRRLSWEGSEGILRVETTFTPWTPPPRITARCRPLC